MAAFAEKLTADYDPIAWFYNQHSSAHYDRWALAMLERAIPGRISKGTRILNICCRDGVVARELALRGYQVTGIDGSEEMVRYARANAPSAEFVCADAKRFTAPHRFEAVMSTFDSLKYMLSKDDLPAVFRNVFEALVAGGSFVFDLNLERRYRDFRGATCSTVGDDHACFTRGDYDPETHMTRTLITLFRPKGEWQRDDVVLLQRCYPAEELIAMPRKTGFAEAACLDACNDFSDSGI
jgi:SAM-dependent methyltransferase